MKIKSIVFVINGEEKEVPIKDVNIYCDSYFCDTCEDCVSYIELNIKDVKRGCTLYDSHFGRTDYVD